ncbi:MAG: cytochrome P450 [bacterium]
MDFAASAPAAPRRPGAAELPPGPRLPKAVQTARFVRRPVEFLEGCAARYGDAFTVRLHGPGDVVVISDPPSLKKLFAADRVNTIAPGRNIILRPLLGPKSVLLLPGGEEHLRRRKLMLPPFHGERMRAYESVITDATEREVSSWRPGERFALHPGMQAITLEVILRAVFGVEDEGRRQQLGDDLVEILATTQSPAALGLSSKRLRRIWPWRRTAARIRRTDEILGEEIALRRSGPDLAERDDILSMLLAARFEDGSAMDDREIRDQLMTLLLAGHETTATSLAWAFDLLFRRPEAMERLTAEVREGESRYLDAVIDETLRLRPVVPFTGRQLRDASDLSGHRLPAGAVVLAAIYLAHMREEVYPQARSFRPERFLDSEPETYSWIPFGGGTRRCLGAAFAKFEMKVALRTILRSAVLRPASEGPERIVRRNVTLAPAGGTPAALVERL